MRRKTVLISDLIIEVNRLNAESTCAPDLRVGWNTFLEDILKKADVYAGFKMLSEGEVPVGFPPGFNIVDGKYGFPDDSRRRYYWHRHLRETTKSTKEVS